MHPLWLILFCALKLNAKHGILFMQCISFCSNCYMQNLITWNSEPVCQYLIWEAISIPLHSHFQPIWNSILNRKMLIYVNGNDCCIRETDSWSYFPNNLLNCQMTKLNYSHFLAWIFSAVRESWFIIRLLICYHLF